MSIQSEMLDRVRKTAAKHKLLSRGDVVLAAVSGGADSVVMLHLLCALSRELSLKIVVFHLNHNLRGAEAAMDMAFVRRLAKRLGLAFEGRKLKKGELSGPSVQEAAREARYRLLKEAAAGHGATRIALGHTLDDQAETVLMRVIKGAGAGIAGIPPARGPYIRPLIDVSRADIEAYAAAHDIKFVTDSSNLKTGYLRNDVRLNLIPYLRKNYNPNITGALVRLSAISRDDSEFIDAYARAAFKDAVVSKSRKKVVLDRARLTGLHMALKSRVLMMAVWYLAGESDIYSTHITSCVNVVDGAAPNVAIDLPGGVTLSREYGRVVVTTEALPGPLCYSVALKAPGTTVVKESGYTFKAVLLKKPPASFDGGNLAAYFDADAFLASGPYSFRQMEPGDRMVPLGMKGRKKIKEIFIENKVPLRQRYSLPLLCSKDEVIWAVGVKRSDRFKVGPMTRRVLRIEARPAKR